MAGHHAIHPRASAQGILAKASKTKITNEGLGHHLGQFHKDVELAEVMTGHQISIITIPNAYMK